MFRKTLLPGLALFVVVSSIFGIEGAELIRSTNTSTRFEVVLDQPNIIEYGGGYSYISLNNYGARGDQFGPLLLGRAFSVAVPKGSSVSADIISVAWSEWQDIIPVPFCDEVLYEGKIVFGNNTLFQQRLGGTVSVVSKKTIRDVEIADIDLMPVEYDPYLGVRFMRSAVIEVAHVGGGGTSQSEAFFHPAFERLFEATLVNPASAMPENREYRIDEWDPEDGAELLVIVYPSFYDKIQPWIDWKLRMGMPTKIVTTTETGTTKAQIKAYIQNAYNTWMLKPAFILFVGDAELVATYTNMSGGDPCLGDNHYGCVDGGDIFPDIFPGRISVDTGTQLDLIVLKHLNYERTPDTTDDWFARAVGIVNEDDPTWVPLGPADSSYLAAVTYGMNQCTAAGFTSAPILRRASGDNFNTARPYVQAGCGFIQYRGQAWPDYYYGFSGGLDTLATNGKCHINISITCGTGQFFDMDYRMCERSTRSGTTSAPKGAVAFMGQAAVTSYSIERSSLSKHIMEGFFEADLNEIGAAHVYGKNALYSEFSGSSRANYEYITSTILGSPEMRAWTAPIRNPVVNYPPSVFSGPTDINVSVFAGGSPVNNARVAIHKGSSFSHALTNSSGNVTISLEADPSFPLLLVATGPNIYPFQDTIDVLASGVGVYPTQVVFEDVGGDGDGVISPGETVRFIPRIFNFGTEGIGGLTASIRCSEPVVWLDSITTFPYLAPGDTVSGDEVRFTVPSSHLGVSNMFFSMRITGHPDGPWIRNIFPQPAIERFNALLDYVTIIDTPPLGNGDNRISASELVDVCITLNNTSQAKLTEVFGQLIGTSKASITQGFAALPFWDSRAEATLEPCFTINLSPSIEPAEEVRLKLILKGQGSIYSYLDTIDIPLIASGSTANLPTGPDSYGYYIIDDTDIVTSLQPTYVWNDIKSIGTLFSPITSCDDCITTISLPFTMRFYGVNYDSATFAANGYMSPGRDTHSGGSSGNPQHFPTIGGPKGIVAPVWADLAPHRTSPPGGEIYYYNDVINRQFVVQWDSCAFYYAGGIVTYQLRICDPDFWLTPTGDSEFYLYYKDFTGLGVMGIGIESKDELKGLEYYLDGIYDPNASVINTGRALRITTNTPTSPLLPWLYKIGSPVIDDSLGNNNGVIEQGETIGVRFTIRNGGSAHAPQVKATILATPFVTPMGDTASFGTVLPGYSKTNTDYPFHLNISPTCPTDTIIEVPIKITSLTDWYVTYTKIWLHVGGAVGIEDTDKLPKGIELLNSYPNPFNSNTRIEISIGSEVTSSVSLEVFDLTGRRVAVIHDGILPAGKHSFTFTADDLPSGCYFARLKAGDLEKTNKVLLIR